jgi:hypothetical protein
MFSRLLGIQIANGCAGLTTALLPDYDQVVQCKHNRGFAGKETALPLH